MTDGIEMIKEKRLTLSIYIAIFVAALAIELFVCNSSCFNNITNKAESVDLTRAVFNKTSHISNKNMNDLILQGNEGEDCFALFKTGKRKIRTIGIYADAAYASEDWYDYTGEKVYATLSSNMTEVRVSAIAGDECLKTVTKLIGENEGGKSVICINAPEGTDAILIETVSLKGIATRITGMEWNPRVPFHFSLIRFVLILFAMLFPMIFRKKSPIWIIKVWDAENSSKTGINRIVLLTMITITALLSVMAVVLISKVKPYTIGDGGFYPYQELARALAKGRTSLDAEPSAELLAMDDPYDYIARAVNNVRFKMDYAFFDGHYYVYFGIIPCLVFFLPYFLITGTDLHGWVVISILLAFIYAGSFSILVKLIKRYARDISMGSFLVAHMGMMGALALPAVVSDPNNYYIPMLMGIACFLWGGSFLLDAVEKTGRRRVIDMILSGVLLAFIAGCRPQMELWVIVWGPLALTLFVTGYEDNKRKIDTKGVACFLTPFVITAAGLMYYNSVRFGNPFEFGSKYNLSFADPYHNSFSFDYAINGIKYYLFRLPSLQVDWPFVKSTVMDWEDTGIFANKPSCGGIYTTVPFLLPGFGCFVELYRVCTKSIKCVKKEKNAEAAVSGSIAVMTGLFVVFIDGGMGGLMDRYKMDFTVLFGMAAWYMLFIICNRSEEIKSDENKKIFVRTLILDLAVLAVIYAASLYGLKGVWSLKDANPELYASIANAVEWWK